MCLCRGCNWKEEKINETFSFPDILFVVAVGEISKGCHLSNWSGHGGPGCEMAIFVCGVEHVSPELSGPNIMPRFVCYHVGGCIILPALLFSYPLWSARRIPDCSTGPAPTKPPHFHPLLALWEPVCQSSDITEELYIN